jgi:dimethylhistidine N-methyltransferase
MHREIIDRRFRLTVDSVASTALDFERAVMLGLRDRPKSLPCRFFYDEAGSRLFEEICDLPEYYLTRAEDEILAAHAGEIAALSPRDCALYELGSGSARKTRRLIEAFLERSPKLDYAPIDISRSMLEKSSRELLESYAGLEIHALAAEYESAGRFLAADDRPKLVLWLGSNVGNLDRRESARFLARLADGLSSRDRLLVGVDLRKPKAILERAYDDSHGVTAKFNLNLLARINRELGGRFDLGRFRHVAFYDENEGRIEMHLESVEHHSVAIEALGMDVEFARGERIHTESSYKYALSEIEQLCRAAHLEVERGWTDSRAFFGLHLISPAGRRDVEHE